MVEQAVESSAGNGFVAHCFSPGSEGFVGSENHAAGLVAATDELEEQVADTLVEAEVTEFIDDQQLGLRVVAQPLLRPYLGQISDEFAGQTGRSRVTFSCRVIALVHFRKPQNFPSCVRL